MSKQRKFKVVDSFVASAELRIKGILTEQSACWYVQYNLPGVGQRRKSLHTARKHEAQRRASQFVTDFVSGKAGRRRAGRAGIQEVAQARLQRLAELGRKPLSVAAYDRAYRRFWGHMRSIGVAYVDQLVSDHLETHERTLRASGLPIPAWPDAPPPPRRSGGGADGRRKARPPRPLRPKPVLDEMKAVRSLIRYAVQRGLVDHDPAPDYKLPPGPTREVETFLLAEMALLYADPAPGMADAWRFLSQTGLRSREFCWLTWDDVLPGRTTGRPWAVWIRRKVCPRTGEQWSPKHGIERVVPLTAEAANVVDRCLAAKAASPWLFVPPGAAVTADGRWRPDRLRKALHARLAAAGIGHGTLHVFRHTCATFLANHRDRPMPLPLLQKFLGHRHIATTERYLHARPEDVGDALARVDFAYMAVPGAVAGGAANVTSAPSAAENVGGPAAVAGKITTGVQALTREVV